MAEAFLEEIYKDAFAIELLRGCIDDLYCSNHVAAREKYNTAALIIESMIARLASAKDDNASTMEKVAVEIPENWKDPAFVTGKIKAELIPLLYDFMSHFTDIDIEDGKYLLKSTRSGFLTLRDLEANIYLHDIDDPMDEAMEIAKNIFRPEASRYLILGCGLGYLPYALWKKSEESISFIIYEDDESVFNYARQFGVLDMIPEDKYELVLIPDKEQLLQRFGKDYDTKKESDVVYITKWKDRQFANVNNGSLSNLFEILTFNRYVSDIITTNIRVNHSMNKVSFASLYKKLESKEWIVVAAGPSLDYNMDFLRESLGNKKVVAVNTAVRRLESEGIKPDLVVAADTNERLLRHIDGVEAFTKDIPLIADEATSWKYTQAYQGERCFVPTPAGKDTDIANPDNMELWDVMGTVSSLAVEAAIRLGAEKVYLLGLDLGYPSGQNYAKGMPHETMSNKSGAMKVKSVDGSLIETSAAFNLFRIGIEQKIAANKEIEFINMSKHGAYIEGAKEYD